MLEFPLLGHGILPSAGLVAAASRSADGMQFKGENGMVQRGSYQKGKIKRREILLAAIEVFSRRGYRGASIREIAESVGLTTAGIFHYFASKEELFVEVLRVREELGEARADDVLEALRLSIEHNAKVEGLVHLFVTVSAEAIDETHPGHDYFKDRYKRLIGLLRRRIELGQETGGLTGVVDPTLAAQALVALADGLQFQWLLNPEGTQMAEVFDTFCNLMLGMTGVTGTRQPTTIVKD
jgi:AcrR family transcriptional regulator